MEVRLVRARALREAAKERTSEQERRARAQEQIQGETTAGVFECVAKGNPNAGGAEGGSCGAGHGETLDEMGAGGHHRTQMGDTRPLVDMADRDGPTHEPKRQEIPGVDRGTRRRLQDQSQGGALPEGRLYSTRLNTLRELQS